MCRVLIGGKALMILGSSRQTSDTDYLIYDESQDLFVCSEKVDLINAAKSDFFNEIFQAEKANQICSAQGLLELKAYSMIHHCQNFQFQKADDSEYDIKFLVRNFGVKDLSRVAKYISSSELKEVQKIIDSVRV